MDKKKGIFQRIADFAKNFFAKDRITSSYTNHYGETTSKTHRRSFETTNERLLNQIGKMKEKETLVLDRNGHFIHLDKNSTKKDLDMFLKSSNQVASIEKQNYSTWEKIKNTYNNRFEKKDKGVGTILEGFVQKKLLRDPERKLYSEKSGTIKDKVKFCHTAIEIMNSEDTDWKLTPKLTKLCERIWAHVIDSNK